MDLHQLEIILQYACPDVYKRLIFMDPHQLEIDFVVCMCNLLKLNFSP